MYPGEAFLELNNDGTGARIEGRGSGREDILWHTKRGRLYMTDVTGEIVPMKYKVSGSTLTITMEEFLHDVGQTVVMTLRRVK